MRIWGAFQNKRLNPQAHARTAGCVENPKNAIKVPPFPLSLFFFPVPSLSAKKRIKQIHAPTFTGNEHKAPLPFRDQDSLHHDSSPMEQSAMVTGDSQETTSQLAMEGVWELFFINTAHKQQHYGHGNPGF